MVKKQKTKPQEILKEAKDSEVTFLSSSRSLVIHKSNPDFAINKSDLIIYLKHFKDAVSHKIKKPKLQTVMEILFYWAIFFTSTFSGISFISGNMVKYLLLAIASIVTYTKILDLLSTDKSKYKETDEEKMADIIETSCKQLKNK